MRLLLGIGLGMMLLAPAYAEFRIVDNNGAVTILDTEIPVFTYHYDIVQVPTKAIPESYSRACYIHPLYFNGESLTEDFPFDHFHHRGVFWAWPECKLGDRTMDIWSMPDVRQRFDKWIKQEVKPDKVVLGVQNRWAFDETPDVAVVTEYVEMTVLPKKDQNQSIDFYLRFTNSSAEEVTIGGASAKDMFGGNTKGYGGFSYRPDSTKKPFTFTNIQGVVAEDQLKSETPWADISFDIKEKKTVGVAMFQHPQNPGYPFPGWMFRHYGFLGASWPHLNPYKLKPGDSFELRYRLFVHGGTAADAKVADEYRSYVESTK